MLSDGDWKGDASRFDNLQLAALATMSPLVRNTDSTGVCRFTLFVTYSEAFSYIGGYTFRR